MPITATGRSGGSAVPGGGEAAAGRAAGSEDALPVGDGAAAGAERRDQAGAGARAGVGGRAESGSCHIFRHTMATAMLENGADLRVIQEILGHALLETTRLYTHLSLTKLREVYLATHPERRRWPRRRRRSRVRSRGSRGWRWAERVVWGTSPRRRTRLEEQVAARELGKSPVEGALAQGREQP